MVAMTYLWPREKTGHHLPCLIGIIVDSLDEYKLSELHTCTRTQMETGNGIMNVNAALKSPCRPLLISSWNLTKDEELRPVKFPSSRSVKQNFTLHCLSPS